MYTAHAEHKTIRKAKIENACKQVAAAVMLQMKGEKAYVLQLLRDAHKTHLTAAAESNQRLLRTLKFVNDTIRRHIIGKKAYYWHCMCDAHMAYGHHRSKMKQTMNFINNMLKRAMFGQIAKSWQNMCRAHAEYKAFRTAKIESACKRVAATIMLQMKGEKAYVFHLLRNSHVRYKEEIKSMMLQTKMESNFQQRNGKFASVLEETNEDLVSAQKELLDVRHKEDIKRTRLTGILQETSDELKETQRETLELRRRVHALEKEKAELLNSVAEQQRPIADILKSVAEACDVEVDEVRRVHEEETETVIRSMAVKQADIDTKTQYIAMKTLKAVMQTWLRGSLHGAILCWRSTQVKEAKISRQDSAANKARQAALQAAKALSIENDLKNQKMRDTHDDLYASQMEVMDSKKRIADQAKALQKMRVTMSFSSIEKMLMEWSRTGAIP